MTLGEKFKLIRRQREITLTNIKQEFSMGSISNWENDQTDINLKRYFTLCSRAEIDPIYLLKAEYPEFFESNSFYKKVEDATHRRDLNTLFDIYQKIKEKKNPIEPVHSLKLKSIAAVLYFYGEQQFKLEVKEYEKTLDYLMRQDEFRRFDLFILRCFLLNWPEDMLDELYDLVIARQFSFKNESIYELEFNQVIINVALRFFKLKQYKKAQNILSNINLLKVPESELATHLRISILYNAIRYKMTGEQSYKKNGENIISVLYLTGARDLFENYSEWFEEATSE